MLTLSDSKPVEGQSQLPNLEHSSSRLTKEASRGGAQLEPSDELGLLCVPRVPRPLSPPLQNRSVLGQGAVLPYQYWGGGMGQLRPEPRTRPGPLPASLGDGPTVTKVHW